METLPLAKLTFDNMTDIIKCMPDAMMELMSRTFRNHNTHQLACRWQLANHDWFVMVGVPSNQFWVYLVDDVSIEQVCHMQFTSKMTLLSGASIEQVIACWKQYQFI